MSPDVAQQIPFALFIVTLFLLYALLIRRGVLRDKAIIGFGILVGILSVGASIVWNLPLYQKGMPLSMFLLSPLMMAMCATYCVIFSYKAQRAVDLAVYHLGDTRVLIKQCSAAKLPDTDILLLPTNTRLKMVGRIPGAIGIAAGLEVETEALKSAPASLLKIVVTSGGKLPLGRIYHIAIQDSIKGIDLANLRQGIDNATRQARKGGFETLMVPLGPYPGLSVEKSSEAIAEAVLRQRRAFAEITFAVLESSYTQAALAGVVKALQTVAPEAVPEKTPAGSVKG